MDALQRAGFECLAPKGAYYVLADGRQFGFADDFKLARHLLEHVGVACVPGSSFFSNPADGKNLVRFCFCKKIETLRDAGDRLLRM
jgi:aminotransferase